MFWFVFSLIWNVDRILKQFVPCWNNRFNFFSLRGKTPSSQLPILSHYDSIELQLSNFLTKNILQILFISIPFDIFLVAQLDWISSSFLNYWLVLIKSEFHLKGWNFSMIVVSVNFVSQI
jgi:hypothetical protein